MSCPFPSSFVAKPDFGNVVSLQYASDHIANKKAKLVGDKKKRSQLASRYRYHCDSVGLLDKTQMNYRLYMEQNLLDVEVVKSKGQSETNLDPALMPFFAENYTIVYQGESYLQPFNLFNLLEKG